MVLVRPSPFYGPLLQILRKTPRNLRDVLRVCLQAKRTHGRIHGNSLKLHYNNMSYWIQERIFSILLRFFLVCLLTFC